MIVVSDTTPSQDLQIGFTRKTIRGGIDSSSGF